MTLTLTRRSARSNQRVIPAAILVWTMLATAIGQVESEKPSLEECFDKGWTVLEFGPWNLQNGVSFSTPVFLIQKLPDKRWLLSKRRYDEAGSRLPEAIRYLPQKEVDTITETVKSYYHDALKEMSTLSEEEQESRLSDEYLIVKICGADYYQLYTSKLAVHAKDAFLTFLSNLANKGTAKD